MIKLCYVFSLYAREVVCTDDHDGVFWYTDGRRWSRNEYTYQNSSVGAFTVLYAFTKKKKMLVVL